MVIEENKQKFVDLYNTHIKREGADKLLEWLMTTDFFVCPASVRFHSNIEGGLCLHSLNVFNRLLGLLENEYGKNFEEKVSMESLCIMALLHDICKVNTYKQEMRNVKENNVWVQKPYYAVDDKLPYGHGEKSVYIISGFLKLTREEAMAINWHMGGFDSRVMGGSYSLGPAFYQYPVALLLHIADVEATYLDEQIF